MSERPIDRMQARARAVRTRAAIRSWEYRQRNLAAGTWFRLRRVLADAAGAYTISEEDARQLVADGYAPEPAGSDLVPEKILVFVDEERLAGLGSRRKIPVALGPTFLTAGAVALVRFSGHRRNSI